jgi:hypothetical protein
MQFQVPQFIEVEDKIVGPFSWKQFIYMLGGIGISYIIFKTVPLFIGIFLIIPILALAGALTFVKVNGRPFIFALESWMNFSMGSKLYVWKKPVPKKKEVEAVAANTNDALLNIPKISRSKLKDISWSLDVLDIKK